MNTDIALTNQRKQSREKELDRIVNVLVSQYRPEKIILFGSLITGRLHEWSDIDLLIIKKTGERPLERKLEAYSLLGDYSEPLDLLIYTPKEVEMLIREESFFISNILTQGKILYEKDN